MFWQKSILDVGIFEDIKSEWLFGGNKGYDKQREELLVMGFDGDLRDIFEV